MMPKTLGKSTEEIRPPAVAGAFYPADSAVLRNEISRFLRAARVKGPIPKAMIVPHAGYEYSGPVAASGYALLRPIRERIERVVVLGPSHRVRLEGLATTSATAFATPLGNVLIDDAGVETALHLPRVRILDQVHKYEHSLEVQLPFLQMTLADFLLVPLCVGAADAYKVAAVIDALWTDDTLVVISSDLSHYHDYWTACDIDRETSKLIEQREWRKLSGDRACGYRGIKGLLKVCQQRDLQVKTVDLRNSGDTSEMRDQVVGYGCYVVF